MELSEIIKKKFIEKGITPAEVSRRSGVPAAQISQIINGVTKNPTWKIMIKLAAALNESVAIFDTATAVVADPSPLYLSDMTPEEKKAASLKAKLSRILEEGDERAIKAIEAQLEAFDPGFKKPKPTHEDDDCSGDEDSRVA